jgi:hypothetical protein
VAQAESKDKGLRGNGVFAINERALVSSWGGSHSPPQRFLACAIGLPSALPPNCMKEKRGAAGHQALPSPSWHPAWSSAFESCAACISFSPLLSRPVESIEAPPGGVVPPLQITGSVACPFGQLSYQHYDDAVPAGVTAALKVPLLQGTLLAEGHSQLRTLDLTYRYKVSPPHNPPLASLPPPGVGADLHTCVPGDPARAWSIFGRPATGNWVSLEVLVTFPVCPPAG